MLFFGAEFFKNIKLSAAAKVAAANKKAKRESNAFDKALDLLLAQMDKQLGKDELAKSKFKAEFDSMNETAKNAALRPFMPIKKRRTEDPLEGKSKSSNYDSSTADESDYEAPS